MRLWPFKAKTPPLGINSHYFYSVITTAMTLPRLRELVNPDASNGAVRGLAVPLARDAGREALNEPMSSGSYGITTVDKDTVLQADVFLAQEFPGFEIISSPENLTAKGLEGDRKSLVTSAYYVTTLRLRAYDPAIYPAVRFFMDCAARLALFGNGIVSDPLAEVYRLPAELDVSPKLDERIDFRDACSVMIEQLDDGKWISSRGLSKFLRPEVEMYGIPDSLTEAAAKMIVFAGQQVLMGEVFRPGETAFSLASPLRILRGQRQKDLWGDREVLEFKDAEGAGAIKGVEAFAREIS